MAEDPNKKSSGFRQYVRAEAMVQLAVALPGSCLVGWLVGAWLDRHFHENWIAIAGLVAGAVGGFVQIFRVASRYLKSDE
jgi:F0F1-type ATP synthase assembly protein I